ncbi:MAG: hypothetical protein IPI77_24080 [Saprospiraceae bacterium]|nr:hypothetical protein [Saprospiraceae bacterium]
MVTDLPSSNKAVDTKYIIGEFYGNLVEHLQPTHDIYTFGYDWRLTLSMSAARLESTIADITVKAPGKLISIIAFDGWTGSQRYDAIACYQLGKIYCSKTIESCCWVLPGLDHI